MHGDGGHETDPSKIVVSDHSDPKVATESINAIREYLKKGEKEEKDSNDKKIGVIMYGVKDKILGYMRNDKIYRYYSSDAIVGMVCVKAGKVRKKLEK